MIEQVLKEKSDSMESSAQMPLEELRENIIDLKDRANTILELNPAKSLSVQVFHQCNVMIEKLDSILEDNEFRPANLPSLTEEDFHRLRIARASFHHIAGALSLSSSSYCDLIPAEVMSMERRAGLMEGTIDLHLNALKLIGEVQVPE